MRACAARSPHWQYQLGMAVRYSRQVLRSAVMREEASVEAATADFEERIASLMQAYGVSYFGRLIMAEQPSGAGGEDGGTFLTAVRYGSLEDARRGSAAVRELMAPELDRWFSSHTSIIGTASRVLEL